MTFYKKILYYSLRSIITLIIGFFVTKNLYQQLGEYEYGMLYSALGILGLVLFVKNAIEKGVLLFLTKSRASKDEAAINGTIWASLFITLVYNFFLLTGISVINMADALPMMGLEYRCASPFGFIFSIVLYLCILNLQGLLNQVLVVFGEVNLIFKISIVESMLKLLFLFLLLLNDGDILLQSKFLVIQAFFVLVLTSFTVKKLDPRLKFNLEIIYIKNLLGYIGINTIGGLSHQYKESSFSYFLTCKYEMSACAVKQVALTISGLPSLVIGNALVLLSPKLIEVNENSAIGDGRLEIITKFVIHVLSSISLVVLFLLALSAPLILELWLGVSDVVYFYAVVVYLLVNAASWLQVPLDILMEANGAIKKLSFGSGLINFGGSVFFYMAPMINKNYLFIMILFLILSILLLIYKVYLMFRILKLNLMSQFLSSAINHLTTLVVVGLVLSLSSFLLKIVAVCVGLVLIFFLFIKNINSSNISMLSGFMGPKFVNYGIVKSFLKHM